MALQFPKASKAPAFTAPAFTTGTSVSDPCCIPGGVESAPLLSNSGSDDSTSGGAAGTVGAILPPTAH